MRIPRLPARPWVVATAVVAAAPSGDIFLLHRHRNDAEVTP